MDKASSNTSLSMIGAAAARSSSPSLSTATINTNSSNSMWVVEYAGCVKINTSMRSLDLDTRSMVVKESIARICEARGVKFFGTKRRKQNRKHVDKMIADKPILDHSGTKVAVNITSAYLTLTTELGGDLIARHEMQNISFASGGDIETMDYVAYVAKDSLYGRACFVLDCGPNLATDVINTLGQAFEMRYKEFVARQKVLNTHTLNARAASRMVPVPAHHNLPRRPSPDQQTLNIDNTNFYSTSADAVCTKVLMNGTSNNMLSTSPSAGRAALVEQDRDYYNDLPGKVPPEIKSDLNCPDLAIGGTSTLSAGGDDFKVINSNGTKTLTISGQQPQPAPRYGMSKPSSSVPNRGLIDPTSNLIDLNTYIVCSPDGTLAATSSVASAVNGSPKKSKHDYVNTNLGSSPTKTSGQSEVSKDPFDMKPFNSTLEELLITEGASSGTSSPSVSLEKVNLERSAFSSFVPRLTDEEWFHGHITRQEAEELLVEDGDFLVRESREKSGQYVLSGRMSGHCQHFVLVDMENNIVRTKNETFESVNHLISYHMDNQLPITHASDTTLYLKHPILAPRQPLS